MSGCEAVGLLVDAVQALLIGALGGAMAMGAFIAIQRWRRHWVVLAGGAAIVVVETTRLRVAEVLKTTKRKFRPFYRMRGSDANLYGTFDQALAEKWESHYRLGDDLAVTWKQVYETREVQALEDVPADQQKPEAPL